MTKTGKVNKLNQHLPTAFLEIHPRDAKLRGLKEGDLAEITSARGNVRVKTKITTDIRRGVVFLPMHWGRVLNNDLSRANNITSTLLDPKSKEPDLKFAAVEVKKYKKEKQKICVIGAGAGAFGFVKSYRELNNDDEIVIFSKENFPFYNRVMLPDYVSGTQEWSQLVKLKDEDESSLNITLKKGVFIEKIDKENKIILDSNGESHSYDVLLVGTGSRAAIPPGAPSMPGIFTMRSRYDADNFKNFVNKESKVVIVGGGLLGLEMAASLHELDIDVTVIQRISRLMDRQLDMIGSQLLHEEFVDKGIEIHYNDEIQHFIGKEKLEGVRLKTGKYIQCDALIFAIGTVPNTELLREAGLECKRGVVVNEYLQTSDPSIYALGEVAEFKGFIFGITAAAEQQAAVFARHLHGDPSAVYNGSLLMNILKMEGVNICSLGMVDAPQDPDYEEVIFIDKSKRYYKKCIIHNDKLVGAILIGDKSEFVEFKDLIENKIELSEKRKELLRSGKKGEAVIGKLVCSCNNVGEGNIVAQIRKGCDDFKDLCKLTGAGMGCGSCKTEVKDILEKQLVVV
jgi:ferredoxin-nitrate reductase